MNKGQLSSALVTWLLVFCASSNAHIGGLVFPIFELPSSKLPDLNDGTLADWDMALPGTSLDHNVFTPLNAADGAGIDPADLAYRVYLAWSSSEQRIYVAIERIDDVYINTYPGGDSARLWPYDSIEFMIDGDHSGGSYAGPGLGNNLTAEERKLLNNCHAQHYIAIAEAPDGRPLGYHGGGQTWVTFPPWADVGGFQKGESPNTSVIELAITPWDELNWNGPEFSKRTHLEGGNFIGFQISIPDFDVAAGAYHGFHTLSGQPNTWREADEFVDGELIPCDIEDCEGPPELPLPID